MSGLREEPRGAARWLILDRPAQRNALSSELIATLRGALVRADADAQARVICVTGSGEQAFCSGMDLASSAAASEASGIEAYEGLRASCDLAVAVDDAQFGTPEVDVGLFPYMALAPLSRCIGRRAALELALTGRRIDAAEALSLGLVNRV